MELPLACNAAVNKHKLMFVSILLFVLSTECQKLNIFPSDAAKEIKGCALSAGWSTAEERFGSKGKADAQKVEWRDHAKKFTDKLDGLVSSKTCNDIKLMFWYQAWRTANERKGYSSDARSNIKTVNKKYKSILSRGELSEKLASNLRALGWNAAWYCANTKYGYKDDAKRDKAKLNSYFNKISGEINLVGMNFLTDSAEILSEKPLVVSEQELINNGDVQQSMTFSFSVTEGHTESTSHEIGFSYGITSSFEAGFPLTGKAGYEVSFEFSHRHTFSESITTGTTKTYEFQLDVPGQTTYTAKGLVHEAEMKIPYELVFDFEGKERTIPGIWKGVAMSKATYQVDKHETQECVCK